MAGQAWFWEKLKKAVADEAAHKQDWGGENAVAQSKQALANGQGAAVMAGLKNARGVPPLGAAGAVSTRPTPAPQMTSSSRSAPQQLTSDPVAQPAKDQRPVWRPSTIAEPERRRDPTPVQCSNSIGKPVVISAVSYEEQLRMLQQIKARQLEVPGPASVASEPSSAHRARPGPARVEAEPASGGQRAKPRPPPVVTQTVQAARPKQQETISSGSRSLGSLGAAPAPAPARKGSAQAQKEHTVHDAKRLIEEMMKASTRSDAGSIQEEIAQSAVPVSKFLSPPVQQQFGVKGALGGGETKGLRSDSRSSASTAPSTRPGSRTSSRAPPASNARTDSHQKWMQSCNNVGIQGRS